MPEGSNVTVSIHQKAPPPSDLIKVVDMITGGGGTLSESIIGGEPTIALELTIGKQEQKLTQSASVFVQGTLHGGAKFTLPFALQTTHTHDPWKFSGKSGVKGP
jgi:hypothetical protein